MASPDMLSQQVLRNLSDRSYDRRKAGAADVEATLTHMASVAEFDAISRLLAFLGEEFIASRNIFHRKGGLAALAAAARALTAHLDRFLPVIVLPILRCFEDSEGRVRYYACESMFNVAKVARSKILTFFNEIFEGVCRLVADYDTEVKTGAGVLNRKMKDIVTECDSFNVDEFVPLLRMHIASANPHVKQLIVGWITTLDSVPEIDMLDYLPQLMEGLFSMLSDNNREVKKQVFSALREFLNQISEIKSEEEFEARVNFIPIIEVLVKQTEHEDEFNRQNAMEWLSKFVHLGGNKVIVVIDKLVSAVIKCLSDPATGVVEETTRANDSLIALVKSTSQEFLLGPVIDSIILSLSGRIQAAQLAALRWIAMLMEKCPHKVSEFYEKLDVLAQIARHDPAYQRNHILPGIVNMFAARRHLLEHRGSYVLRRLCQLLDPQTLYIALAEILLPLEDLEFISLTIEILNILLLTASELVGLRDLLRGCLSNHGVPARIRRGTSDPGAPSAAPAPPPPSSAPTASGTEVFVTLYTTWCHSPVATFSLCLLAQAYPLACALVSKFAETQITVGVLMQVDKLVQLIESPVFVSVRMHLLEPSRPDLPYLLRSLYGLLMLLPQGPAFQILHDRLASVTALHIAMANHASAVTAGGAVIAAGPVNQTVLLGHFDTIQDKHDEFALTHKPTPPAVAPPQ